MPHELTRVGSTQNTEYLSYGSDILIISPAPGYKDNAQAARINIDYQQDFARRQGKKCGVVVVMNGLLSQDAESRKIYSEGMDPRLFYGAALVVGNPLARAIGSFFMGLSKPAIPLTLVNSIESGIDWLETQRNQEPAIISRRG